MGKWEMVRLGDVCDVRDGTHDSPQYVDNGYPLVTSKNVVDGKIDITNVNYISKVDMDKINERSKVDNGDIIMPMIGTIGNPIIVEVDFDFAIKNVALIKFNRNVVVNRFICYLLESPLFNKYISIKNRGGTQKFISLNDIRNFSFLVPSIEEQQKIAATLDKITDLINLRKKELEKLDLLVKSRFSELFVGKNYPMIALDNLALSKGEYGAQSASVLYDQKRPRYVRITDINDDGTLNDDVVSSANVEDDEQYKLSYGDFLFARMGATVGKTYAYKSGNQIFAGYLIRYKLNLENLMPEYLYVYTKLEEYKNWVLLNQSGAAQPGINAKKFGSLLIPVAPLEEQRKFKRFVEKTDKSKYAVKKSLEKLETLKKALMQEYFG